MAQGLPIQGAEVQEIQGGMRLTALGLGQLGSAANAVGTPGGLVPELANPGGSGTAVAVARPPSLPATYLIDIPATTDSTTSSFVMPVGTPGVTAGFLVTSVDFVKTSGTGHSGTNTIQLFNGMAGSDDITEAVSFTTKNAGEVLVATEIDVTNALVASGGTLRIVVIKDGGGNSEHRVIINGLVTQ